MDGSSRPDIVYEVHQRARFAHDSKNSHEVGLTYIIRYLKGTKEKDLILSPDTVNLQLDLYKDTHFSGLTTAEDVHDPISVKNRSGLIMNFGGVPIFWSSKPQL